MPQVEIRTVSDEALGACDWMLLVFRAAGRIVLAVRSSVRLSVEQLRDVQAAIESARASLTAVAA